MKNLFKLLLAILFFVCFSIKGYAQTKLIELEIGTPVVAELNTGDTHIYSIILNANTQFNVNVESTGIDIQIELIAPTGEVLNKVNEFSSLNAVERLVDVSENSGIYKLRIKSCGHRTPKGKYQIELLNSNIVLNSETYNFYLLARKTFMAGQRFEETEGKSEEENIKFWRLAVSEYEKCVGIYKSVNDVHRVCEIASKLADIYCSYLYSDPDSYENAMKYYQLCLQNYKSIQSAFGESTALNNIGYVFNEQKKYSYALDYYQKSATISREILRDSYEEGLTLYNIGVVTNIQGKLDEALQYYEKAIELLEEAKVFSLCGKMCNELLRIYKQRKQKELALKTYDRQLQFYELANDYNSVASSLSNKGAFASEIYDKDLSINAYQESLKTYEKIENKEEQAKILNEIGTVYEQYGENYKAMDFYEKALSIIRTTKNRDSLVSILNNLGVEYLRANRFEESINCLFEAMEVPTTESFKLITLSNTGLFYSYLSEIEKSLFFYEQALALAKKLKDIRNESIILINIAIEQIKLGNLNDARNNLDLALTMSVKFKDELGQANALSRLGDIELKEGNTEKALDLLRRALQIRIKINDFVGQIYTRNLIGIAENILGHAKSAIENLDKALEISKKIFNESAELTTTYTLAKLEFGRGNLRRSADLMNESIGKIELVRSKFVSPTFQSNYFATKQKYYELYINILMDMHKSNSTENYDEEAFFISEKMRARALLELLSTKNLKTEKINSTVDYEMLNNQLSYLASQIIKLKNENSNNTYEISKLEGDLDKTKTKLEVLKTVMFKDRRINDVNRVLKLDETQKLLDNQTVLIQYTLSDKSSYAWLVTDTEKFVFALPSRTTIEKLTEKIYTLLTERNQDFVETLKDEQYRIKMAENEYMVASRDLSNLIILPMKTHLNNKKRLIISPDGGLYNIPFNALPYNSKFLIETYEIVVVPSVSTLNFIREAKTSGIQKIAVFADPIFSINDPRISKVDQTSMTRKQRGIREFNFTRLEGTTHEAESIKKFFPKRSEFFVGPAAKKEIVQNLRENSLSLHFGTHSLVFHNNPQLSCIVLNLIDEKGRECQGFLTVDDILNLKISPELVTLSSCQSAKGKELPGEGVISLTRAFFYIGAKRVVSSLWSVDDNSTAQLMSKFYESISNGLRPSSALRQAQMEMLRSRLYKSPYYWAAFQLQGECN